MSKRTIGVRSMLLVGVTSAGLMAGAPALAQAQDASEDDVSVQTTSDGNVIIVEGIRQSLATALDEKRASDNIVEVINAEDVGKLPDQNLAEVLENITGVQLDRSLGVGTAVQIRGTGDNRIEINGNSTTPAGTSRTGINFQDLPSALIASVEVTKVPTSKTIEGSVGGTINLRTFKGLDLKEPLLALRADAEYSDLAESTNPRISATIGNKFDVGDGELGIVLSGSYIQQDVASFNPRFDRDRVALPGQTSTPQTFPFFRTQFLQQTIARQEFETLSFTGSLEYAPSDNLKLFFNGTYSDQEEAQQNTLAFFSGAGSGPAVAASEVTAFETINLGTLEGPNGDLVLGEVMAATQGIINLAQAGNGVNDPNLRTSIGTGSRLTETYILSGGFEWQADRLTAVVEGQLSRSESTFPALNVTLDFINPNGFPATFPGQQDNGTPAIFDATDGTLQFGIAQGLPGTPTVDQLLDPANYTFRLSNQLLQENENSEGAFRVDFNFDTEGLTPFITSFDFGLRWSETTSENSNASSPFNAFTRGQLNGLGLASTVRADLFSSIITQAPDNFGDADGRELFLDNFLVVDPALAFDDPQAVIAALNTAGLSLDEDLTVSQSSIFDISEETFALYAQANYDSEIFGIPIRGNLGLRWINTEVTADGFTTAGGGSGFAEAVTEESDYSFFLPRWNFVAEPANDFLLRGGIARDIRRPNFNQLSPSTNFPLNANPPVAVGNPGLEPETVWSFDVAGEYYFAEAAVVTVAFFHKIRDNIVVQSIDPTFEDPITGFRGIAQPCVGGIFNPVAPGGIFSESGEPGICADAQTFINSEGTQIQQGIEVAFQYDLSAFEDTLGFASGFGFIGNFTWQRGTTADTFFDGSGDANDLNDILGRTDGEDDVFATPTLDDDVVQQRIPLGGLSDISYNLTLFYEKYGLSARARYSFRSDFFNNSELQSFDLPRIIDDRGQLNANISYKVTDFLTVAVEGINLLREDRTEFCVNDEALLCDQGLTDRRFTFGARLKF